MTERLQKPESARFSERDQKAEIVDRLYEVALDPIRLEDLLVVWEERVSQLRLWPVDQSI